MTARDELFRRVAGAFIDEDRANGLLDAYRAELAEEFAAALLADTAHIRYGSATDYAERHAALIRRMAAPTTTKE